MIHQRVRQLARASVAPSGEDFALARGLLSPGLFELFLAQHPRDIVHSAETARWLLRRGHDDHDLLVAGLLHDVGKGEQRRRDRVAYVVAGWAGLAERVADGGSRFELRRAMQRTREHSRAGAAILAAAGASARSVDLTLRHHSADDGDPMLALLQQADAAS